MVQLQKYLEAAEAVMDAAIAKSTDKPQELDVEAVLHSTELLFSHTNFSLCQSYLSDGKVTAASAESELHSI